MKADTKEMDELDRILVVRMSANSRTCHVGIKPHSQPLKVKFMLYFNYWNWKPHFWLLSSYILDYTPD